MNGGIQFGDIFQVGSKQLRDNLCHASTTRNTLATLMKESSSSGFNAAGEVLSAAEQYLPVLTALKEQIVKSKNMDMKERLYLNWTSVISTDKTVYSMVVFDHELVCVYATCAFAHYMLAEEAMELGIPSSASVEEKKQTQLKYAATHLKAAAGIFTYLADTLLPSIAVRGEKRPIETYQAACDALAALCLCHMQEGYAIALIQEQQSDESIAKVFLGVSEKYESMEVTLMGLKQRLASVSPAFLVYLKSQATYFKAMACIYMARVEAASSHFGRAITFYRKGIADFISILNNMPDINHVTLKKLAHIVQTRISTFKEEHLRLEEDNNKIYFDGIPSFDELSFPKPRFAAMPGNCIPTPASSTQYFDQ